ncbi:polyphosphate kinase 1 [Patiriisocius marinus]|uniref:Polyphosphate kinase n=1 Tax=Patiriisocius marinus TaxID=1397112 RepID=A0A5J4ILU1_9FLAO|nr:polyphosphate kinase 1 [Patiriisocius marinus]GER58039.1 polyphosphate kinase [Patiriisocius marinus]
MSSLYNTKYFHRDLSWLRFNHRVLQEAADARNPLYERIKFLAIFSSNLDEFFKVRVSDIRQIKDVEKSLRKRLIRKPNKVLKEIKAQVDLQQTEFGRVFKEDLIPDLAKHNIYLIDNKKFSPTQKLAAKNYFDEVISPLLKVQVFKTSAKDAVFVKNEALYLTTIQDKDWFQFVEIPAEIPRFFTFPKQNGKHYITFIDDIIRYNLRQTPKGETKLEYYSIKISRDAELYIEDEFSGDLKDKIEASLSNRETGQATRVLIDQNTPKSLQEIIKTALDINKTDIVAGGTYHNFKDFFGFPNPTEINLSNEKLTPLPHKMLSSHKNMFDAIDAGDQLIHYPYQTFEPVIRLLEEAAVDKYVKKIRITIYRAASKSRLNDAIALAAENGKEVTVFIEVKARFDERNNLKWGKIFEEKGATVIYSYPDIKVHSKILLISREIDGVQKRYGYIATGNFNEKTAALYTDFGLMTSHKKITKELHKVFLVLDRTIIIPKTSRLLVSPFTTRVKFTELVNNEIALAQAGEEAYIILKMNSLEDKDMIKLLYRASEAGVKIRLLIRGICSLVPGIKGQSENIYITSIIDRYLEHGRIYIFGNQGDEQVYIGSADWMTRNLNHRIEVVTPILDISLKRRLRNLINIQIADNVKARVIDEKQKNNYVTNNNPRVQSQLATYEFFR